MTIATLATIINSKSTSKFRPAGVVVPKMMVSSFRCRSLCGLSVIGDLSPGLRAYATARGPAPR